MTDRPILFSAPMIRAILREIEQPGTGKTMTRRLAKDEPRCPRACHGMGADCGVCKIAAPFKREQRLWVRETWGVHSGAGVLCTEAARPNVALPSGGWSPVVFRATTEGYAWGMYGPPKWRPAIHMPRTASRITLTVTGVKVERLHDISEQDAKAEGVPTLVARNQSGNVQLHSSEKMAFALLWDSLNGKREGAAWADNPWVVAVSFRPELRNIDAAPAREAVTA